MKMKILVVNDDGIRAEGIYHLVKALSSVADIYVCAPDVQRSASGHSISIGVALRIEEVPFEYAKLALEITGTPADCVKLGLKVLDNKGIKIDMVFSGINHGGNLGTDTLYSGTVSAAIEGAFNGIPSIAVSVNDHFPTSFEYACDLAVKTLKRVYGKLNADTILNINVPNLPAGQVKGLKYTRLGKREYENWFREVKNEAGKNEYWYSGVPVVYENLAEDIDVKSMQDGYASITPLHYDLTSHKLLDDLKKWGIEE
jgi:5'-nucleotidase